MFQAISEEDVGHWDSQIYLGLARAQVAWCYELDVFDQQVSLLGGTFLRNWYKVVPHS